MNIKQLLEKLAVNWGALAICFVLSLIIYFFYQMSTLDRKVFTVPLSVVENGEMTAAANVNHIRAVRVSVRAHRPRPPERPSPASRRLRSRRPP